VAADLLVFAVPGIPEIAPAADLARVIAGAVRSATDPQRAIEPGDVFVVAQKVVSKAEDAVVRLGEVTPSALAIEWAAAAGKDPRVVEVVLAQSKRIVRMDRGVLITETHHGFVCANAGVDASNAGGPGRLVLLPLDPDASARRLRARLRARLGVAPAVVVTDSFGRAWRIGQAEVAIGCAGLAPVDDWRGRTDTDGRELHGTVIAIADEAASAADLVRDKGSREPAVRIRGLGRQVPGGDGPGAAALLRAAADDLFG